jgi:hypothetical protein
VRPLADEPDLAGQDASLSQADLWLRHVARGDMITPLEVDASWK